MVESVVTLVHERVMVVVVDKEALAHFVSLGADWIVSGPAPVHPLSRTLFEPSWSCHAPHLARKYPLPLWCPSSSVPRLPPPSSIAFLSGPSFTGATSCSLSCTAPSPSCEHPHSLNTSNIHIIPSTAYAHAVHPYTALTVWSCPRLFPQASRIWLAAASSSIFHDV